MRLFQRYCIVGSIGVAAGIVSIPVVVTEGALHIHERPHASAEAANRWARDTESTWEEASIEAAEHVRLDGWFFRPRAANGGAVLLLHGVGDTRLGIMGQAALLLKWGYAVLAPDSRGHGASGGETITYGILEAEDIARWAAWLAQRPGVARIYGLGESMGAANLIESLPRHPGFRAIVAECPFATFAEIAEDRFEQHSGVRGVYWRPMIWMGFFYARMRYGIEPWKVSPEAALRETKTPVLLIHGTADRNIPTRHSRELHAESPGNTEL